MRQLAIKWGLIGGLVITVPMFIIIPNIESIGFTTGITTAFVIRLLSFIVVYIGISQVRSKVGGGFIGFRLAFVTGLFITVLISFLYSIGYEILLSSISPDFMDKYNAFTISQLKAMKAPQSEIDSFTANSKNLNQNFFIGAAQAFILPFLTGMFFTFSSALILRKKEFTEQPLKPLQ